ncbi:MAG: exo-alpha-sialidase [Acidobacteria bacterium]|nr:exo-alpha-sialidase [Acidobacteriota bacterium]MCB9399732.1 exo-alpha-sialidase [Acidobacteriota bacterium]
MTTIWVSTRKGLLGFDDEGTLKETHFLGDPVVNCLPDPRDGRLYASLNLGHFGPKLRVREAGQAEWKELTTPQFPENEQDKASLVQIWTLVAGHPDRPGHLYAGCIPAGFFESTDGGNTWNLCTSLWEDARRKEWFGGGYDQAGIHSILVHPSNPNHLTIGISCGGVWISQDGGKTFEAAGKGLLATFMPPERQEDPNIQDPHCVSICHDYPEVVWVQHHCGVFRSTDGGRNFKTCAFEPYQFGFAVQAHPKDPNQAWFIPATKDECRVPVNRHLVVLHTGDGGKTYQLTDRGLPNSPSFDLVYRHGLAADSNGKRLVFGSTTGGLWFSSDGGHQWQNFSSHLPPIYAVTFAN